METLQLGYISKHGSGNMHISEGTIYIEMCMRHLDSRHLVYYETENPNVEPNCQATESWCQPFTIHFHTKAIDFFAC